jgi:hypothetical protein
MTGRQRQPTAYIKRRSGERIHTSVQREQRHNVCTT